MIDHKYAKELINKEYDELYMIDFFNRYKNELSNVESSKRAIYIVILLLGDSLETAKFVSKQYDLFYNDLCCDDCERCEYSKGILKREKNIDYMSCFTYYILSILLNEA